MNTNKRKKARKRKKMLSILLAFSSLSFSVDNIKVREVDFL